MTNRNQLHLLQWIAYGGLGLVTLIILAFASIDWRLGLQLLIDASIGYMLGSVLAFFIFNVLKR